MFSSSQHYILYYYHLRSVTKSNARILSIIRKYYWSWTRWCQFTDKLDLRGDTFIDLVECQFRTIYICLFASTLRAGELSKQNVHSLAKGTILETMSQVAASFWPSPRYDQFRKVDKLCSLQLKDYGNADSPVKQQQYFYPSFFRTIFYQSATPLQLAIFCYQYLFLCYVVL